MGAGGEAIEVVVARIDERVAGLLVRFDDFTEGEVHLRSELAQMKDEARRETTTVRVDLERQIHDIAADLAKHETAVNPHPNQEAWLRGSADRLATSIDGLRTDLSSIRNEITGARGTVSGATKVLSGLGAVALVLLGAFIRYLIGG